MKNGQRYTRREMLLELFDVEDEFHSRRGEHLLISRMLDEYYFRTSRRTETLIKSFMRVLPKASDSTLVIAVSKKRNLISMDNSISAASFHLCEDCGDWDLSETLTFSEDGDSHSFFRDIENEVMSSSGEASFIHVILYDNQLLNTLECESFEEFISSSTAYGLKPTQYAVFSTPKGIPVAITKGVGFMGARPQSKVTFSDLLWDGFSPIDDLMSSEEDSVDEEAAMEALNLDVMKKSMDTGLMYESFQEKSLNFLENLLNAAGPGTHRLMVQSKDTPLGSDLKFSSDWVTEPDSNSWENSTFVADIDELSSIIALANAAHLGLERYGSLLVTLHTITPDEREVVSGWSILKDEVFPLLAEEIRYRIIEDEDLSDYGEATPMNAPHLDFMK